MIAIKKEDSKVIITVTIARIEISNVRDFSQALESALIEKPSEVVINCKQVRYLDSSGLATLTVIFKKVREYGGRFMLSQLSPSVLEVFKIARLDTYFEICD